MSNHDHPYFQLRDGRRLLLPLPPNLAEFNMAGNGREFGEFLAFYDGTTQTGATFYTESQVWHLQHPLAREVFWTNCELMEGLAAGRGVVTAMVAAALDADKASTH